MDTARFQGFPFLVFDAEVEEDLKTIVLAGCRLERNILWAGSGGLARCLPLGWGLRKRQRDTHHSCPQTLTINGSFNPTNKEQLSSLEQVGTKVCWIDDEDADDGSRCRAKVESLLRLMDEGKDVALSVRLNKPIRSASHLQGLQDALQFAAAHCLASVDKIGLVLIGGDTAIKLYRNLHAGAVRIEGEVQPGVPHGRWMGGRLDGQPLVTKAGGFGQPDTLAKAIAFLKRK
jgi:uncharacterized protein YgbK (DUF1537 family)